VVTGKTLILTEIGRLKELHQNAIRYEGEFDD
jgi:hypothetical protein